MSDNEKMSGYHNIFIMAEGEKTELNYFRAIKDNYLKLNINPNTTIIPIERYGHLASECNLAKKIFKFADDYKKQLLSKKYVPLLFSTEYVNKLRLMLPIPQCDEKKYAEKLRKILEEDVDENGMVDLTTSLEKSYDFFLKEFGMMYQQITMDDIESYDEERGDKIVIVVDKDKNGISYFIQECSKRCYLPYATNPCFELWVGFHFGIPDNIYCNNDAISYVTIEFQKIDIVYDKANTDFSKIMEKIDFAIENLSQSNYCKCIENLQNKTGTNIHDLIQLLRDNINTPV